MSYPKRILRDGRYDHDLTRDRFIAINCISNRYRRDADNLHANKTES